MSSWLNSKDQTTDDHADSPVIKERGRPSSVRDILSEHAEHTSLHGVWQASNPSFAIFRRLIWSLAVCCGVVIFLIVFIRQLLYFLEFPVQTILSVDEETSLYFPSVTICNYNQFKKSLALRSPDLVKLLKDLFSVKARVNEGEETLARPRTGGGDMFAGHLLSGKWDLTEELIALAHTFNDTVIMCFWCGVKIRCRDYFSRTLTEVGVCYTFNSHKTQQEKGEIPVFCAGSDCGLVLRINIQSQEYYFGEGDASGIKVLVHDPLEVPLVGQQGFSVAPGTAANAGIKSRQELLAERPYGKCVNTSGLDYENPLQYYDVYTHSACKTEHKVNYIYEHCGCRMYYDPSNLTVCTNTEQVKCVNEAKDNYTRWAVQDVLEACPRPCQSLRYGVSLSTAAYPSDYVIEELKKLYNMTDFQLRRNIIQLRIYYEELSIQNVRQIAAYPGSALFADVGGTLGLCIGGSILTVIELLELILLLIRRILMKK